MSRIGVFSLPWAGHLHPLGCLGQELNRRGHQVAFFQRPEFGPNVQALGLDFVSFGSRIEPPFWPRFQALGGLQGPVAMNSALQLTSELAEGLLQDANPALQAWSPDLLIIDQMDYAASTLAQVMSIPFVTVAATLLRHDEEGVPGFDGRPYQPALPAPRPPALLEYFQRLDRARHQAGLDSCSYANLWSTLAQISQQPAEFEFPRTTLPPWFHFTGPFCARSRTGPKSTSDFPWHRLSGRPLVYVSLGTVSQDPALMEMVVKASQGLDLQLVISAKSSIVGLDPQTIVVPFAPQRELLQRASVMVTHAGMNSALECQAAGVPMLAVPMAHDQPGVACRVVWSGTGLKLDPQERRAETIRAALLRLLGEPTYRLAAQHMQKVIAQTDGAAKAADIVETVIRTGQPVIKG